MCSTSVMNFAVRFRSFDSNASLQTHKPTRLTIVPRKRQRQIYTTACNAIADHSCIEERHTLPDGFELEVISSVPNVNSKETKPPLLFIHGSVHGAWCWKENFMPYFSERGYSCYALSLRGQGKSDLGDLKVGGTLESHSEDVLHFVDTFPSKPVLVGHSAGGLLVQFIALQEGKNAFSGFATLCSAPPSGTGGIIWRITTRTPIKSFRITIGILARTFKKDSSVSRMLFFSDDLPEEKLIRYQSFLADCGPLAILDMREVNKKLPLPPPVDLLQPVFVLGAENDSCVDKEAIDELAEWFGVEPIFMENMAHDVMLDTKWEEAAQKLYQWLEEEVCKSISS